MIAAEGGDFDACRRLVEAFLPAIGSLARSFQGSRVERPELLQEGIAGLLFAARRYDPGLNTPFWAYASFWVRKAMQELVAELTHPVALSDRAVRDLAQIGPRPSRARANARHGTRPRAAEPRDGPHAGTAREPAGDRTHAAEHPGTRRRMAIRIDRGRYDRRSRRRAGLRAGARRTRERARCATLTERLEERERTVIRAHYGLGTTAQTLSEIGAMLGLTAERARQIEVAALGRLRAALTQPAPISERRDLKSARAAYSHFAADTQVAPGPDIDDAITDTALRHNALVYESPDEYLARAVPFLQEGIAAGEGAIVAHTGPGSR